MGKTSEDYLDSLLRAAMEPTPIEEKVEEETSVETVNEEVTESPIENVQDEQLSADDLAALFAVPEMELPEPEPIQEPEPISEPEPEQVVEPEPVVMPVDDNPNKQLSADEIAAMFAAAETAPDTATDTAVEESLEEVATEDVAIEENPLSVDEIDAMIAALDDEPKEVAPMPSMAETKIQENPVVMPIDDNPNKQLSADEIAAMFAAAEPVTDIVVETPVEEVATEALTIEENPLSVDEIDAMIASLEEEPISVPEPVVEPEPVVVPIDDNPNKQLSPDEIAAMFAAAGGDTQEDQVAEVDNSTSDEGSLDDLLAMADSMEEMAIDLDNVDDLDALLGLREVSEERHWDAKAGRMVEGKAEDVAEDETADGAGAGSDDMDDLAALLSMTGGADDDLASLSAMTGTEDMENQDLADLLGMLGDDDGDLAEINELLQKSDNHEIVEDDEMLALLGGLDGDAESEAKDEIPREVAESASDEPVEKKPKKKLFGRKKKEKAANEAVVEAESATKADADTVVENTEEKKPKGKGFFGKLFEALTEEVEDEEDAFEAVLESEGMPLDKKTKNKKKKDKKGKKKDKQAASNDEILEEMDEEDVANAKGKGKKKGGKGGKKPGKSKKEKKAKAPEIEEPGKKLPKKMMIRIFVLCFSLLAVLILVTILLPHLMQKSSARKAFYQGNYEEAYQGLAGQELNESDQILLHKAEILVQLEHKVDVYATYNAAGMKEEALNALFEGVAYYWENDNRFDELGIRDEANTAYAGILILLQDDYGIKEDRAKEIVAMDSISYTYEVRNLASGVVTVVDEPEEIENGEEEPAEPLEDLLEEEQ